LVFVIRGRSPAFTGSYLPAVFSITECRTDQLYWFVGRLGDV